MPAFDNLTLVGGTASAKLRRRRIHAVEFAALPGATPAVLESSGDIFRWEFGSSAALDTWSVVGTFSLPKGVLITNVYLFRESDGAPADTEKDTMSLRSSGFSGGAVSTTLIESANLDHTSGSPAMTTVAVSPTHQDVQVDTTPVLNEKHWYTLRYDWLHKNAASAETGTFYGAIVEYQYNNDTELREPT
jgi:hypothetical protein